MSLTSLPYSTVATDRKQGSAKVQIIILALQKNDASARALDLPGIISYGKAEQKAQFVSQWNYNQDRCQFCICTQANKNKQEKKKRVALLPLIHCDNAKYIYIKNTAVKLSLVWTPQMAPNHWCFIFCWEIKFTVLKQTTAKGTSIKGVTAAHAVSLKTWPRCAQKIGFIRWLLRHTQRILGQIPRHG